MKTYIILGFQKRTNEHRFVWIGNSEQEETAVGLVIDLDRNGKYDYYSLYSIEGTIMREFDYDNMKWIDVEFIPPEYYK